jgi:hypothetical protein
MNYKSIIKKIEYWENYKGTGDEYRKTHDLDCILTGGNLYADTIISLWLPLRYTLNYYDCEKWQNWKKYEMNQKIRLKDCQEFLQDLRTNIKTYLPEGLVTEKLIELFKIGQTKANIMILPYRKWNTKRGWKPYFDYLPHFLFDLFNTPDEEFLLTIKKWVIREKLESFFDDKVIDMAHIKDLAGTGAVHSHRPIDINISFLLSNYLEILRERAQVLDNAA